MNRNKVILNYLIKSDYITKISIVKLNKFEIIIIQISVISICKNEIIFINKIICYILSSNHISYYYNIKIL